VLKATTEAICARAKGQTADDDDDVMDVGRRRQRRLRRGLSLSLQPTDGDDGFRMP